MLCPGLPKNPPGLPPGQYGSKLAVQVGYIMVNHTSSYQTIQTTQEYSGATWSNRWYITYISLKYTAKLRNSRWKLLKKGYISGQGLLMCNEGWDSNYWFSMQWKHLSVCIWANHCSCWVSMQWNHVLCIRAKPLTYVASLFWDLAAGGPKTK